MLYDIPVENMYLFGVAYGTRTSIYMLLCLGIIVYLCAGAVTSLAVLLLVLKVTGSWKMVYL